MKVNSWEEGDRPTLMTRARLQAPAARKAFTEMLASQDWATYAYVIIDWTGRIAFVDNLGQSHDGPVLDRVLPVMYIQVIKSMPQLRGSAIAETRLDIDDVFGGVVIAGADIANMVLELKEELLAKEAQVRQEVSH